MKKSPHTTPWLAVAIFVVAAMLLGACSGLPADLVASAQSNGSSGVQYSFTGTVQSIGADAWTISGHVLPVSSSTQIGSGIQVGSTVEVKGSLQGLTITISSISLADPSATPSDTSTVSETPTETPAVSETPTPSETAAPSETPEVSETPQPSGTPEASGTPEVSETPEVSMTPMFKVELEFRGTVSAINGDVWSIGSKTVTVDSSTKLENNPAVGDMVEVHAVMQSDGSLLATNIAKLGNEDSTENSSNGSENENEHQGQQVTGTPFVGATPQTSLTPSFNHEGDHEGDHSFSSTPVPGGDQSGNYSGSFGGFGQHDD
jgi:hypothetical protein